MEKQKQQIVYVKCKNCGAKAKFIIEPPGTFDWTHFPCPLCNAQKLRKVDEKYPEEELDFQFKPESAEQEQ